MDNAIKRKLREEIQLHMFKYPGAGTKKIKKLLKTGSQMVDLDKIKPNTLNKFIKYNIEKCKSSGNCVNRAKGGGRKKFQSTAKKVKKVKEMLEKKGGASLRKVANKLGMSHETCRTIARKSLNLKPLHKHKVQKMTKEHKSRRVDFAKWLLETYSVDFGAYSKWSRLVNSDFSAIIRVSGVVNTKNDVIWAKSTKDGGDLLEFSQEKFAQGEMVFGAVTYRGLVPARAPVYVSDLLKHYDPKPNTVTAQVYADMLDRIIGPAVKDLYPRGNAIWQDDPATIHRAKIALEAVARNFKERIPHDLQASKMADVWPIENVWAILKSDVKQKDPKNVKDLRSAINASWRRMSQDTNLCKRLITSIPARLKAVIKKKGSQVTKEDYN